jgi:hypothetical protein
VQDTVVRRNIARSENEVRDGEIQQTRIFISYMQKVIQLVIYFKHNIMGKCSRQSVNRIVLSSHKFPS